MATRKSGQGDWVFEACADLSVLPEKARPFEGKLHGGFAVDRQGRGHLYYGMPGCGLMRVRPDLTAQEIVELPPDLKPINFHSVKIVEFDGKRRLVMPANDNARVVVLSLDGALDFILSRPEFDEYRDQKKPFAPTDTAAIGSQLYVADGYGSNYIATADLTTAKWTGAFAGFTSVDTREPGKFGTAHGLNVVPGGHHGHRLAIADRPHSRIQVFSGDGTFEKVHGIVPGSLPCGIDFHAEGGRLYAVVGSLDAPEPGRPAPIYVLDGETYAVLSTIRPKEDLGIELAMHIHNTIWYEYGGRLFLVCQAWNPGHYFVLERVTERKEEQSMRTELTEQQVSDYRRDGFVAQRGFLSPDEVAELKAAVLDCVEQMGRRKLNTPDGGWEAGDTYYDRVFTQRLNLWRINPIVKRYMSSQGDPGFKSLPLRQLLSCRRALKTSHLDGAVRRRRYSSAGGVSRYGEPDQDVGKRFNIRALRQGLDAATHCPGTAGEPGDGVAASATEGHCRGTTSHCARRG